MDSCPFKVLSILEIVFINDKSVPPLASNIACKSSSFTFMPGIMYIYIYIYTDTHTHTPCGNGTTHTNPSTRRTQEALTQIHIYMYTYSR